MQPFTILKNKSFINELDPGYSLLSRKTENKQSQAVKGMVKEKYQELWSHDWDKRG